MTVTSGQDVKFVYRLGWLNRDVDCWRVVAIAVDADDDGHSYYEQYPRLVNNAELLYADKQRFPRCPDDPYRDEPSPEELAVIEWEHVAAGLTPTVTTQPVDASVVGLPTFILVEGYQPAGDTDTDPTTVTWDFGAFQLRGTSAHQIAWDDGDDDNEFAYPPTWQATNGRNYIDGDEDGPTGWTDGQPHWQGDVEPLAWIYQEDGSRDITIDVRWQGEWRLAGGGPWLDLAAPDLFAQATVTVDVVEYQAVVTQ